MVRQALVPNTDGSLSSIVTNTAADLSDTQLADAIVEADSLIDGYLSRLYTTPVPLTTDTVPVVPHPVDYWSRNLAAYNATLSFRGSQDFADQDPVARRYMATMDALKQVSAGTIGLNLPRNVGDSSASTASDPINPYVGELFCIDDFDLSPARTPWLGPFWGRR